MTFATMMDVPLTIDLVAERAERWMGASEVVSRRPDKTLHRTTYGAIIRRARQLTRALIGAGIRPGDRVATLMWNHAEQKFPKFWIPDAVIFADAIPRTSADKFKMTELRETYRDHYQV